MRRPRLTWASDGNEFRRLRVTVKAGEVVDIAMLAHGSLLKKRRQRRRGRASTTQPEIRASGGAATMSSRTAGFCCV